MKPQYTLWASLEAEVGLILWLTFPIYSVAFPIYSVVVSSLGWENQKSHACSPSNFSQCLASSGLQTTKCSPFSDVVLLLLSTPERNIAQSPLEGADYQNSSIILDQALEAKFLVYEAKMLEDSFHTAATHKVVYTGRAGWESLSISTSFLPHRREVPHQNTETKSVRSYSLFLTTWS